MILKRLILSTLLVILTACVCEAQQNPTQGHGAPSGVCTAPYVDTDTGNLYTCKLGAFVQAGGGISSPSSIPGQPGLTAIPVTSGLMAEYRLLPTENPCAAIDYSGNSRNATGCDGTAPIIQAGTGGFAGVQTGSVILPASLNSAVTVLVYFSASIGANSANGLLLAGNNSGGANSNALLVTVNQQPTGGPFVDGLIGATGSRVLAGWFAGANPLTDYSRSSVSGNVALVWVMGASSDQIYINGVVDITQYTTSRGGLGHQTAGAYELGGTSSCNGTYVSCTFLNNGNIYYAAFWNRALSAQEVASVSQYVNSAMTARGVPPTSVSTKVSGSNVLGNYNLVADGDSITCGTCIAGGPISYVGALGTGSADLLINGVIPNTTNTGIVGLSIHAAIAPSASQAVDPFYAPNAWGNVDIIWAGTNDAGTTMQDGLRRYCTERRLVGWKCLTVSMISRTGSDTTKNTYGAWMRQHWAEFADGFADMAASVNLGADGANGSATYFMADHIHPTQMGVSNEEVPVIQRAINRLFGNNSFQSATTYSSAAAAATATTAGTFAANILTVTFGATPANCQAMNTITLAGITPAADNGNYTIQTRSATQVTVFNSLGGNITVQGTGVCPQQQDQDVYQILNFGAGNYTLESCVGYTGQNLYFKNINAGSSTIVPFQASETIDGAANIAIAQNVVRILQAQLISPSAAGCTWKVIQ